MPKRTSKRDQRGEILRQTTGPGGTSSPALDAMLSEEFVNGTNVQAAEIAAAVVKLFGGQLEQTNQMLAHVMKRMDEMDKTAEAYEADRQKWLNEINRQADKLRVSEEVADKMKAQVAQGLERKIQEVRAQIPLDRKMFEEALRREPQVSVTSGGKSEIVMEGGVPVAKLFPEEIRVKHLRFVLMPGVETLLPQSIADAWKARKRSEAETRERQELMKKNLEVSELDRKMKEIDLKYKSSTQHLGQDDSQIYTP